MTLTASDVNATDPYLNGIYAPIGHELTSPDLPVIGELPADLEGVFVRNGPNPKYAPVGRYHWFDGDGMLHAVQFAGGRAQYRNRWIQTAHLATEDNAGHALWRGLMEPTAENPASSPYKDTANTDVVYFGGELLTSWYISGEPYRVDPVTLDTRCRHAFGGDKPGCISAHAKVDPVTGELCFFRYGRRPSMTYGVVGSDGVLAHETKVALPGPRLPHDMAITQNYSILMDLPVFPTEEGLRQGRWQVRFHRDVPARFGILPRRGNSDDVRWFEAAPCYLYHTVNAWEEDGAIVLVGCRVEDPTPPAVRERDGAWARMMANLRVRARLHRWRFDLKTGATSEEPIDDRNTEFPALNQGRLGRASEFSYNVRIADSPTLQFDGIVKYNTSNGNAEEFGFGPGRFGSEPGFAPRAGQPGVNGAEDDGYVLCFVHDQAEDRSELVVFDAQSPAAGPLARVLLPARVPIGFHACWVPGTALAVG